MNDTEGRLERLCSQSCAGLSMKAADVILLQSDAFARLRAALMYRDPDGQAVDAGYDSDLSLEAFDLSEGPNTEGANFEPPA